LKNKDLLIFYYEILLFFEGGVSGIEDNCRKIYISTSTSLFRF